MMYFKITGSATIFCHISMKRVDILKIKCLNTISNMRQIDQAGNDSVRERCGIKYNLSKRADDSVVIWKG